jgi:riboflavin synthase
MFTGIVAAVGTVRRVRQTNRDLRIEIESALELEGVAIGASVLCAGCCLTLIDRGDDWFAVEAIEETRALTTAGRWHQGIAINLERAMRLGDGIDGHMVTGHIDGMGEVVAIVPEGGAHRIRIRVAAPLHRLIAKKGSVAVDGVSLTVTDADGDSFEVCLIPHTRDVTTLGALTVGAPVNIEVDMLARYLARWIETEAA